MAASRTSASTRIIPPIPGQSVPKEYVRQQLYKLGIKHVTEDELEYYAADLTELIRNNFVEKNWMTARPEVSGYGRGRGAAIFKTFPGDKEKRIQYLTPSPSLSLLSTSAEGTLKETASLHHPLDDVSTLTSSPASLKAIDNVSPLTSSPASVNTTISRPQKSLAMKRKVLRSAEGDSKVVEETQSVFVSDAGNLADGLSELSLTSTDTRGLSPSFLPGSRNCYRNCSRASHPPTCCRSFIRPSTSHPHNRGVKKCDPVARYHEFRALWELMKPPGERPRYALRWQIREQLMRQDVPYYEPHRKVFKPNDFVVPTDKKRASLRWQVRHALAHQ